MDKKTFKITGDFYKDLAMRESSNLHNNVNNRLGYIGLYQFGEGALEDIGFYIKPLLKYPEPKLLDIRNNWEGKWLGKYGIKTTEEFLNNRNIQEIAVREYHKLIWEKYLKDYHGFENSIINGIRLTKNGMIAAAHLVGFNNVKKFIESNGTFNKNDSNNISCIEYLLFFENHKGNYNDPN